MALKDIFTMVKADRYTKDGREEVIKAQEAETEDKVYQIGEISQKTGLQKTANGWVKPRNGKTPGAKTGEGTSPNAAGSKATPAETKTFKSSDIERVDKNNLKLGEVSATKNPDNTWSVKNAEGKEVSRALRMEDVKEAMVKSANRKPGDTKFPNVSKEQKIETLANHYRERYGKTTEEWAKTLKEVPEETLEDRYEEYAKKHPTDSAPRVLTGDTRIRVRKS